MWLPGPPHAGWDTKRHHPDLITTFHVAHSLFATNRPKDKFPDSLAIDSADNMLHYGPNTMDYYGKYFDKAYVEDNWRWWIYYPTEDNSFGKYMLNAADYMINDLGCKTIWADGWISGYVRDGYTFDFWDGNSVTIDPDTKKVTRKKACVPYVALPVLTEVTRKFEKAGGMVISNGRPGPLSYQREAIVTSCETGGGDQQPIEGGLAAHSTRAAREELSIGLPSASGWDALGQDHIDGVAFRPGRLIHMGHGTDVIGSVNYALGPEKSGHEIQIIAPAPHGDGCGLAFYPDLQRSLVCDLVDIRSSTGVACRVTENLDGVMGVFCGQGASARG